MIRRVGVFIREGASSLYILFLYCRHYRSGLAFCLRKWYTIFKVETRAIREKEAAIIESDELIYSRYLAEGNEDDFRILLERHKESLTLFLYCYVHIMEDAEELMLDAYAVTAAGGAFAGKSSFKTWRFSIGKKLALMRLRERRTGRDDGEQTDGSELTAASPELDILKEERNRQLYRALSALKSEYRQILILLYFEDMTHEQAAKVMGKTKRQTYHLAERGKLALKEKLERMGFDYARY